MITEITTIADVEAFAHQLVAEGLIGGFHPDDPFEDYVSQADQALYSPEAAALRNRLMAQCFTVCELEGADVYETVGRITLKGTPSESIFDEDHEEKYELFMKKAELGIVQIPESKIYNRGVLHTVRSAYN